MDSSSSRMVRRYLRQHADKADRERLLLEDKRAVPHPLEERKREVARPVRLLAADNPVLRLPEDEDRAALRLRSMPMERL